MSIAITAGYLAIGVVASMLGVCTKTLRRWYKAGTLQPIFRTPGNHRRYDRRVVLRAIRGTANDNDDVLAADATTRAMPRAAIYCRVSSTRQKLDGELDRQHATIAAHCDARGYRVSGVYKDVGSGLNDGRHGLLQLEGTIDSAIKSCFPYAEFLPTARSIQGRLVISYNFFLISTNSQTLINEKICHVMHVRR